MLFGDIIGATVLAIGMGLCAAYMLARVVGSPELEGQVRAELSSFLFVVLTASVLMGLQGGAELFINHLLGVNDACDAASAFLSRIVYQGLLPTYADVIQADILSGLTGSFTKVIGPSVWGISWNVFTSAQLQSMLLKGIGLGLLAIYSALTIQIIGLSLVKSLFPLFFPVGIFLYLIPYTRNAGAFVISAYFAFKIVFVGTLALSARALDDMSQMETGHPFEYYQYVVFNKNIAQSWVSVLKWAPFARSWTSFLGVLPFLYSLSILSLIGLFIPSLAMLLTIAFINATTRVLLWQP